MQTLQESWAQKVDTHKSQLIQMLIDHFDLCLHYSWKVCYKSLFTLPMSENVRLRKCTNCRQCNQFAVPKSSNGIKLIGQPSQINRIVLQIHICIYIYLSIANSLMPPINIISGNYMANNAKGCRLLSAIRLRPSIYTYTNKYWIDALPLYFELMRFNAFNCGLQIRNCKRYIA